MRLEASHLDFGYPGHRVGSDVSLSLEAGEVLCLLGPNGSGKTTLFKTLLGLLPAQGGQVLLDGADLRHPDLLSLPWRFAYRSPLRKIRSPSGTDAAPMMSNGQTSAHASPAPCRIDARVPRSA